jgi:hypothetical protein
MALNNNKCILIYGFEIAEQITLNKILTDFGSMTYKTIQKGMANMKLKDILEGMKFEIYSKDLPENEKVILFNNFSDEELNKMIVSLRNKFNKPPILAIITATSSEWTFKELILHLVKEREFLKQNNKI